MLTMRAMIKAIQNGGGGFHQFGGPDPGPYARGPADNPPNRSRIPAFSEFSFSDAEMREICGRVESFPRITDATKKQLGTLLGLTDRMQRPVEAVFPKEDCSEKEQLEFERVDSFSRALNQMLLDMRSPLFLKVNLGKVRRFVREIGGNTYCYTVGFIRPASSYEKPYQFTKWPSV